MIGDVTIYANYLPYAGYSATDEPSVVNETYESSGGETTGPAYDVADNKRTTLLTIDTNAQTTNPIIDFDLTTNMVDVDFAIIDNHNFNTAGVKVGIAESLASIDMTAYEASGPGVTTAASTVTASQVITPVDGISLILLSTATTGNDWKVGIEENGANYTANVTIGEIILGKKFAFSYAPDTPEEISTFDGVTNTVSRGGQKSSFKSYGVRKAWKLSWPILLEADKTSLQTIYEDITEGSHRPFYIDLGEESTPKLYYVRFMDNSLRIRKLTAQAYEVSFMIESEI